MIRVIDVVQYSQISCVAEEVFSSNTALWFSPDSRKLAYATFDDNRTRIMSIPFYGLPGSPEYQYTHAVNVRYPKVGIRGYTMPY
jgi:hypothetical protein